MAWYKERVWQLGIGALLVLAGTVVTYLSGAGETVSGPGVWIGLVLIFIGLAVPLIEKLVNEIQERQGEEGEL